jgi:glutathione synthase/RimK-type ligase-like ATP-grasp enzyme
LIWSALSLVPAPMVNTLTAQLVHPRKVHHLRTLAAAGVPVPPFVATNDADVIRDFVSRQPDGAVLKPLRGFAKTRLLQAGEELPCLTRRPVLVQRYVPGATVRVYAVSGRPVAAGEMRNAGHVDTSVDPRAPVLVEPTGDERTIVARAARAAGLPFTGLDLQRPRDGGPAQVLECNAAPMFANFCRRTGADVAGPLADLLVRLARGGEVWKEES